MEASSEKPGSPEMLLNIMYTFITLSLPDTPTLVLKINKSSNILITRW